MEGPGKLVAKQGCRARILASQKRAVPRCSSPFQDVIWGFVKNKEMHAEVLTYALPNALSPYLHHSPDHVALLLSASRTVSVPSLLLSQAFKEGLVLFCIRFSSLILASVGQLDDQIAPLRGPSPIRVSSFTLIWAMVDVIVSMVQGKKLRLREVQCKGEGIEPGAPRSLFSEGSSVLNCSPSSPLPTVES